MITNKIKFSSKLNIEFINELRSTVNEFFEKNKISKYGNWEMVAKTIFMMVLYFTPYFLMLMGVFHSLPILFLCWFIMGVGMAGVGMGIMHDANHGSYSKSPKVNAFVSKSLYLLGGFPATWQYQHNTLHHGFTNIEGHDDDIAPLKFLRFSPHRPLSKIHKFQFIYAWFFYGLMTVSWTTFKDFSQLYRYKLNKTDENKKSNRLITNLILGKLFYYTVFLIIPLVFTSFSWYWILLSFYIMHFTCGFILGIVFQTAHVVTASKYPVPDENGNMENNWAIHQLLTTSDYAPKSRLFSWFIGGLNYQVEHHLFPNICHIHYKKIAALVKKTAAKYNVPYHVQPTFLEALINHAKMLRLLGRRASA